MKIQYLRLNKLNPLFQNVNLGDIQTFSFNFKNIKLPNSQFLDKKLEYTQTNYEITADVTLYR